MIDKMKVGIIVINPVLVTWTGQNIWNKVEKSGIIGQEKKILISAFACFLTVTAKL